MKVELFIWHVLGQRWDRRPGLLSDAGISSALCWDFELMASVAAEASPDNLLLLISP